MVNRRFPALLCGLDGFASAALWSGMTRGVPFGLRAALRAAAAVSAILSAPCGATAEETKPLRLRVTPSGFERPRESLEDKIERRMREDYRFRSICRGCLPAEIEARIQAKPPPVLLGETVIQVPVPEPDGTAAIPPETVPTETVPPETVPPEAVPLEIVLPERP